LDICYVRIGGGSHGWTTGDGGKRLDFAWNGSHQSRNAKFFSGSAFLAGFFDRI